MKKSWWKSRTLWLGVATGILGIFQTVAESGALPPGAVAGLLTALGVANVVLRWVTTEAIG